MHARTVDRLAIVLFERLFNLPSSASEPPPPHEVRASGLAHGSLTLVHVRAKMFVKVLMAVQQIVAASADVNGCVPPSAYGELLTAKAGPWTRECSKSVGSSRAVRRAESVTRVLLGLRSGPSDAHGRKQRRNGRRRGLCPHQRVQRVPVRGWLARPCARTHVLIRTCSLLSSRRAVLLEFLRHPDATKQLAREVFERVCVFTPPRPVDGDWLTGAEQTTHVITTLKEIHVPGTVETFHCMLACLAHVRVAPRPRCTAP
jgi:hypothetical protein